MNLIRTGCSSAGHEVARVGDEVRDCEVFAAIDGLEVERDHVEAVGHRDVLVADGKRDILYDRTWRASERIVEAFVCSDVQV